MFVVKHCAGMPCCLFLPPKHTTHLKQLDVCVEQVTLGDVDALATQFMHQLQDPSGDNSLAACGCVGKRALGCGILLLTVDYVC